MLTDSPNKDKIKESQDINDQIEEFFAKGGEIEQLDSASRTVDDIMLSSSAKSCKTSLKLRKILEKVEGYQDCLIYSKNRGFFCKKTQKSEPVLIGGSLSKAKEWIEGL